VTVWSVLACMAIGYLIRALGEVPNRFADVDALRRDRLRAEMRDV